MKPDPDNIDRLIERLIARRKETAAVQGRLSGNKTGRKGGQAGKVDTGRLKNLILRAIQAGKIQSEKDLIRFANIQLERAEGDRAAIERINAKNGKTMKLSRLSAPPPKAAAKKPLPNHRPQV